jgi:hypothetical protein
MEKYFCAAHLRREGIEVPATAVIEGEAMCAACFKGKAIRPEEEHLGLMNFLPRLDRRKKIRAQSTGTNKVRCPRHPLSKNFDGATDSQTRLAALHIVS